MIHDCRLFRRFPICSSAGVVHLFHVLNLSYLSVLNFRQSFLSLQSFERVHSWKFTMKNRMPDLTSLSLLFSLIGVAFCAKGCVELDTYNFEKIVNKFDAVLVKFDNAYPYGPEHDAFEEVCDSSTPLDEFLVAEVQVKDYGEKENQALAHKYGARKKDYPALKLFIKGQDQPLKYDKTVHGDVSPKNIKKFIKSNTGIHVSQPGCIREFDVIVLKFIKTKDEAERKELLKSAEDLLEEYKDKRAADVYVKLMKKVIEKGDEFVKTEMARVDNILKEKLTKDKQAEMTERINILESFHHDEL